MAVTEICVRRVWRRSIGLQAAPDAGENPADKTDSCGRYAACTWGLRCYSPSVGHFHWVRATHSACQTSARIHPTARRHTYPTDKNDRWKLPELAVGPLEGTYGRLDPES